MFVRLPGDYLTRSRLPMKRTRSTTSTGTSAQRRAGTGGKNLASGATLDEVVEWLPDVDKQQIRALMEHEAEAQRTALAR